MGSDKLSAAYRRDCARAEEEALQVLRSVHMPVINIPSMRGITLANYRRRMVKCDGKMWENDIVLVAATDFVAASLACPTLFGWNVDDTKEQVSALLADLGRRWTRLLSIDQSRRAALSALLESSLRCLDDEHTAHFADARRAAQRQPDNDVANDDVVPEVDAFARSPPAVPSPPIEGFKTAVDRRGSTAAKAKASRTLHAFFTARGNKDAVQGRAKAIAASNEATPDVQWLGTVAPQVFPANQGMLLVFPANQTAPSPGLEELGTQPLNRTVTNTPPLNLTNWGTALQSPLPQALTNPGPLPSTLTNQGPLSQTSTNQGPLPSTLTNQGPLPSTLTNQGPLPLTSTNQGPLPLTSTNQGPLPSTSTNQGPLPPTSTNQGPLPPTSTNQGPLPLTSTNQGPLPLTLTNQGPLSQTSTNQGPLPLTSTNQGPLPPTSTNQGPLPPTSTNQGPLPLTSTNQGPLPLTSTNQDSLPLVNATNVAKPASIAGVAKPPVNALQAMMNAAKENQRKRAAICRPGPDKLARKAW